MRPHAPASASRTRTGRRAIARDVFQRVGDEHKPTKWFVRERKSDARTAAAYRQDALAGTHDLFQVGSLLADATPYSEVITALYAKRGQLVDAARFCCNTRRLALLSYKISPTLWHTPPTIDFWCGQLDMQLLLFAVEDARRKCRGHEEAGRDELLREMYVVQSEKTWYEEKLVRDQQFHRLFSRT